MHAELGAFGRAVRIVGHPHPLRSDVICATAEPGQTIAELLPNAHLRVFVFIDEVLIPRAVWGHFRPRAGAVVTVRALPAGDDAKKILRTVAQIALMVYSAGLSNVYMAAAVAVVGNLAINALLPPQLPELDAGANSFDRKQALTGTRNQPNPFGVVPRVYGQHRFYPPYAALPYTEALGENQYLRVLLNLGYGPLNVTDIRIGTTPLANFEEVEYEINAAPALFSTDVQEEALSLSLNTAEATWTRNTAINANEISLDLVWPQGMFWINESDGSAAWIKINYLMEYRRAGIGGAWSNVKDAVGFQVSANFATVDGTEIQVKGKARETRRLGVRWKVAVVDQYEVRVTRKLTKRQPFGVEIVTFPLGVVVSPSNSLIADSAWVALRTIRSEMPSQIPGTILMAMRIRATDQLNGVTDRINVLAESILPTWNGAAWVDAPTSNPAWIFVDIACGSATERKLDKATRFHLAELKDWADANAAAGREYNAVIDSATTVYQLMRDVASVGRASFANRDGKYTVVRDLANQVPVQHFTPRNSWSFRGSRVFQDVPHALRVQFVNPDADWQQDERIVYADGYNAGNATKFEVLQTRGCTDAGQAWREGRYHLAVAKYRSEIFSWNADVEHIRCTRGDLVRLTHDVIEAGLGAGRIKGLELNGGGAATKLFLDETLTMQAGTDYAVRIRKKDGTSVVQQVTTVAGDVVELIPTAPIAGLSAGELFQFGVLGAESLAIKITKIEPGPNLSAQLTGVLEAVEIQAADAGAPPAWTSGAGTVIDRELIQAPVPIVDSVRSDHLINRRDTGGVFQPGISLRVQSGRDIVTHEVRYRFDDMPGGWIYQTFPAEMGIIRLEELEVGQLYDVQVRAIPNVGLPSAWVEVQHELIGTSEAPPAPTSPIAEKMADGIRYRVVLPDAMPADWWLIIERAPDDAGAPGAWAFRDKVQGSTYMDRDTGGNTYWYRSYLVNFLGIASALAAQVSAQAKLVEDGAGANVPSMVGVKKNKNTFNGASNGYAYLHGFTGGTKADVDGVLYFDDALVAVPKGAVRAQVANRAGYILFEPAGGTPFVVGGVGKPWAFAWRNNGQWTYDDGAAGTNFAPTDSMVSIGMIKTGAASIKRAVAWSMAMELDTLPEPTATVGARAGANLLNASGGVVLGDADVITSQGTSADTSAVSGRMAATVRDEARRGAALREGNLIPNGLLETGDIFGLFSAGTFKPLSYLTAAERKITESRGVIETPLGLVTWFSDTYIPVEALEKYAMAMSVKWSAGATQPYMYLGLHCYDQDQVQIKHEEVAWIASTDTTLAAEALAGATSIQLTSATNWAYAAARYVAFDTDPSADRTDLPNRALYPITSIVGTTVNLGTPLAQTYAAGTNVREHLGGGTYTYVLAANIVVPATLTRYAGVITGMQVGSTPQATEFRRGTKFVRLVVLTNRTVAGGSQADARTVIADFKLLRVRSADSEVSDGLVYGRVRNTAVNANREVDLALVGVVGRTLANIADTGSRFAAVEANANRTETRTSADTTAVNGVAAATVQGGAARANAGLDASGDLARNVLQARADSSNLLRRTAGGLFTGELAADLTSTHTSADTTAVNGVAAATVQGGAARANAGLDASGDLARNVLQARADSSNLLRRTAGGLFTGELAADLTSTHTSADTTAVNGVAAATVQGGAARANAGLDASGDLARNITSARADSSNVLRRTGGGLFTGALAATAGATWGTDVASRPTELIDGRVATAINGSGQVTGAILAATTIDGVAASTVRTRAENGWNLTQVNSGVRLGDVRNAVAAHVLNKISFQSTATPVTAGRDFIDPNYDYWTRIIAHTMYAGGLTFAVGETYTYGLTANTDYYHYADISDFNFASYTVVVSTTLANVLGNKARVYFGKAHTPNTGGGGGGGVGGGGTTQPP